MVATEHGVACTQEGTATIVATISFFGEFFANRGFIQLPPGKQLVITGNDQNVTLADGEGLSHTRRLWPGL